MRREGFFLIGITFFLLMFFSGRVWSEQKGGTLNTGVTATAVVPGGEVVPVDPMEGMKQPPSFRYNAFGRRDPFLSFVKPQEQVSKGVPPLEQVDISQLKLVGVAWGGGGYSAMIQVPAGKSYLVKRGMRIGTNQGRIKDIGPKEIIVEEPYLNIYGRSDLKQVVMKLYTKKEGIE